ncbi:MULTISPECIES: nucleotidyltransferase family protein [Dactylosporangium]|uniref:Uncharacterized protein n=2 Tax=Dactylosporangium TaxID=35753 RepID=A0A9W6KPI6_9ACTN|nr:MULTISPECIES: nucleotidyltransferase family protein [Dactylosporangium]UAB95242.1 nucleotidyltransferase family protein [Dactylosporangium vinaceum]UWZ43569.1 nucleotidyltransferase family protein [Dactylosporangium matsuzakiense]GLL04101.1 hypothetical protein GCM10017581_058480 [Dactylosporangium matsuzakiense]
MATSEDSQPLIATLKKAAFHLKDAGIPFCLAGSFAVYARGGESVDHDIDFLIKEEDAERVLASLAEVGFRGEVPPEGWLVKAWDATEDGDLLIDFIFCPVQRPVTDATMQDTDIIAVNACHMPVLSATELMIHKVLTWSAHYCDYARGLPVARSLREQIDWPRVYRETAHSPYAHAFLFLIDRLGVVSLAETTALAAAV